MSDLTLSKAYLIGSLMEGLLYGVLTTIFFHCLGDLTFRRRTANINYVMLVAACVMWMGCTTHFAIAIHRTVVAFNDYQTVPGGADAYLALVNTRLWLASEGVFIVVNSVADLLLVYRCWLIWNNNYWIVIGPLLSILGSIICAFIALIKMGQLEPGETIAIALILHSAEGIFSFSLVTNVTTTLLIAGRILFLVRRNMDSLPRGHSRQYISVIGMVIESGVLMAVTQAVFLGLWSTQNLVLWAMYAILDQIMAISPMLIIVRASASANATNPALSVITPVFHKTSGATRATLPTTRTLDPPYVLTEIETHRDPVGPSQSYDASVIGIKRGSDPSLDGDWQA